MGEQLGCCWLCPPALGCRGAPRCPGEGGAGAGGRFLPLSLLPIAGNLLIFFFFFFLTRVQKQIFIGLNPAPG